MTPSAIEPPPLPRREGDTLIYADALVARVQGFRPLLLDLFVPKVQSPVRLVVWLHGGAWMTGSPKRGVGRRVRDHLLAAGFAVASAQYRLSGEATFPAQIHDVKAAIRWLRHYAGELGLDPERFAVMGESAGGHLAALAALTGKVAELEGDVGLTGPGSHVRAAVDWYGPSDLGSMQSQSHPAAILDHDDPDSPESRLLGAPVQSSLDSAALASPVTYAHPDAPPMLIVHGNEDVIVPHGQSAELADALDSVGAPHEFVTIEGAGHGFRGVDIEPIIERSVAFLVERCGPAWK